MPVIHQEQPQTTEDGPVWAFRFTSEKALRQALEEYTAGRIPSMTARYGEEGGGGVNGKTEMIILRKRWEIDRCIEALDYPWFARLLDLYYRWGCSCEHNGWSVVARALGLRGNIKSKWDRDTFDVQVDRAVSRLWKVHEERKKGST